MSIIGGGVIGASYVNTNSFDPFGDGSGLAFYKLDNNTSDESGAYPLTAVNMTYATGIDGQCGVFNNTAYGYNETIDTFQTGPSSITFSGWFTTTAPGTEQRCEFNSQVMTQLFTFRIRTNSKFGFYSQLTTSPSEAISTTTIVANKWYHVTGTFDLSTGTCRIYVNGKLEGTHTGVGTAHYAEVPGTYRFVLGGNRIFGNLWRGNIDKFRIFKKAISPIEAYNLFANGG